MDIVDVLMDRGLTKGFIPIILSAGTWHNITTNAFGDYMADWGYMVLFYT